MKFFSSWIFCTLLLSACSTGPTTHFNIVKSQRVLLKGPEISIGTTSSNQKLFLGGFSGLSITKTHNAEDLVLTAIADRGPTGQLTSNKERPFLLPDFSPQILSLKVNVFDSSAEVVNTLRLQKKDGKLMTGLPLSRAEESPVDVTSFMYSVDPNGINPQSIVSDDEGGYWVGDNYVPSLVHFDKSGKLIRRLMPFNELPKIYSDIKSNQGFTAIAKDQNKLFGFLQSPRLVDDNFSRIVEVDLDTLKTSNEYYYEFEKGLNIIGDAAFLGNNKFLVIEKNGNSGLDSRKYIYKITLDGADKPVKKEFLIDLSKTLFKNLDRIEGIAVINPHQIAIINNNSFQINGATDFQTGLTPMSKAPNEILILEFMEDITI
jgi:3-phytase